MESKLSGELKNTPRDTSLVPCSVCDRKNERRSSKEYANGNTNAYRRSVRRQFTYSRGNNLFRIYQNRCNLEIVQYSGKNEQ
jgi:hypothetical protein